MALLASGAFAIFQSITGHFLPHDVHALGMDADGLARAANPNLVRFMFHDRVAFGGTLLAIGMAYWWLAEFPLRAGAEWAWGTLAALHGLVAADDDASRASDTEPGRAGCADGIVRLRSGSRCASRSRVYRRVSPQSCLCRMHALRGRRGLARNRAANSAMNLAQMLRAQWP